MKILVCIADFFIVSTLVVERSLLSTNREVLLFENYAAELASLPYRGDLPLLGIGIIINNILYLLFIPVFPCEEQYLTLCWLLLKKHEDVLCCFCI